MAPDETEKPIHPTPEEPKAEAPAAVTPPVEEPKSSAETAAAPATPPVDTAKQMSDAAKQAEAGIDKALSGVTDQNKLLLVAIVSILIGGWLGAILNGQVMKGVAILVAAFVCFFLGFILAAFTFGLGFLLPFGLHIVAVVDAIVIANRKNKGETFAEWDFFWKPAPAA